MHECHNTQVIDMHPRRLFTNLAPVTPDKLDADRSCTSGDFPVFSYFNEEEKNECLVISDPTFRWSFSNANTPLEDKKYMYIVDPEGSPFMFNATVHSQANAGKPVRCAGWIDYVANSPSDRIIDNCSGHYTPTLCQFITTIHQLHNNGLLPDAFLIKLSKFTKIDVPADQRQIIDYFQNLLNQDIENMQIQVRFEDEHIYFICDDQPLVANTASFLPVVSLNSIDVDSVTQNRFELDTPCISNMHPRSVDTNFSPSTSRVNRHLFFLPESPANSVTLNTSFNDLTFLACLSAHPPH
ncbi:MAG: hypothetical protein NTW08_02530 [Gammaproteobacteria bacterium]|nr:hypothetical protein [Gammaproteobacteria bacterium]